MTFDARGGQVIQKETVEVGFSRTGLSERPQGRGFVREGVVYRFLRGVGTREARECVRHFVVRPFPPGEPYFILEESECPAVKLGKTVPAKNYPPYKA